jgi:hypothetical protein
MSPSGVLLGDGTELEADAVVHLGEPALNLALFDTAIQVWQHHDTRD